ncbi:MAG: hypothetical protein AB7E59_14620 [Pusillimonas sp.]
MKRILAITMAIFLAGCAANPQGIGLAVLEQPSNLRGDRDFTQDLVQIQRAVFQHQAVCNPEVKFSVDHMNPNFARVTKPVSPGATGWAHTIVLNVVLTKNLTTKGRVYSYYGLSKAQVNDMYAIVLRPEYCPEKPEQTLPEQEQASGS